MTKDPVCGMDVDIKKAESKGLVSIKDKKKNYFCSKHCKDAFEGKNEQQISVPINYQIIEKTPKPIYPDVKDSVLYLVSVIASVSGVILALFYPLLATIASTTYAKTHSSFFSFKNLAIFAMVVVFPVPLIPQNKIT